MIGRNPVQLVVCKKHIDILIRISYRFAFRPSSRERVIQVRDTSETRRNETLYGSTLLAARAETYRRLLAEALPFAKVELAWMRQRQHVANAPGMVRNIQAAFASTAMMRGETIDQTVARLWGVLGGTRRAA